VPHPTFCGKDFLDIQDRSAYTSTVKKQCLIKQNIKNKKQCLIKQKQIKAKQNASEIPNKK